MIDPIIKDDVVRLQNRAKYFSGVASVEREKADTDPERRDFHLNRSRHFYTKVRNAKEAIEVLTRWFVTPEPSPDPKLPNWIEELEASLEEDIERTNQVHAFANAVASFPEPLIILSVSESGHVTCPEGEILGWVR